MSGTERYPELTAAMKERGFIPMLRLFGPGAIIASVTIGSGETVFASRGGALFGHAMLWCFVGGGLMKFVQVYTAARYATLTGEHPIERWKYLPGPQGWAVWLLTGITLLCFPLWLSGLPKMLGGLTVWIFDLGEAGFWGDARIWGTGFVVAAITLTLVQTYAALERMQTIIVALLLIGILVAALVLQPDWLAILLGTLVPSMPTFEPWVAARYPAIAARSTWVEMGTYLGAIGGGTQDYFGYIGMLKEKSWGLLGRKTHAGPAGVNLATDERNTALGKGWLRAPFIDSSVSFGCIVAFTMAFMVLGAVVLHPKQVVPSGLQLLSVQAQFLTLLHPNLVYLYQVGVFTAFFGTILGAYELYVRTTYVCLRPILPRVAKGSINSLRPWVVTYCGIGGVTIMWLGGNPVNIVTPAAILGGVLTCGLWCFLMVWTDLRFLPAPLRMGWLLRSLNLISGTFLTGWGVRGIYDWISSLFA